ncbi:MAG: ABC transporter ATP-binding protein [Gemmatimonadaceae bacterium]|nr:ABC transporter ATP-binding protein [Gemmatimonadaceae bacterium]
MLSVERLSVAFATRDGTAQAVDDVSFAVEAGETVCVVGESGCGKSMTALSLLRLVPPPGHIQPGSAIHFDGRDLLSLDEPALRTIRGRRMSMIFQEPMTALNPVLTIGEQIAEVVRVHTSASRHDAWTRAVSMLRDVGIADPELRAHEYPHQLSGGMRQRVMIAMALVLEPQLVIADEPTTALDVTIQAQILELLSARCERTGLALLLITHDLGVVAEMASRVLVMYAGQIVEEAPVAELFAHASHPYTEGLLAAVPRLDQIGATLRTIPGTVPSATQWPTGCRFRERCAYAFDRCAQDMPALTPISASHQVRCHLIDEPARRVAIV